MENIKVIIWGFGAMGSGMAKMLLGKKGVDIVGVCDIDPNKVGKSLGEVLGMQGVEGCQITDDIDLLLEEKPCDVALLCTDSFLEGASTKIMKIAEKGINVISTAEEMAYPKAASKDITEDIHQCAKKHGVTVLGTGINPGLMMDFLALLLTGACDTVDTVTCERVNNLSPFGPVVMEEQGVGFDLETYETRLSAGKLAGHVGFHQSIHMIADGLGWKVDQVNQSQSPIVSNVKRESQYAKVEPGQVAGIHMLGEGIIDGEEKITMIHPQQIEPQLEEVYTGDYIRIKGNPDISMAINPEVPGGIGTIAMCVNMIPHVINARSGLKTMLDLPIPRAIMGDMRDMIERDE